MNSECLRIADQLRRAFDGDAWHGPPLRQLLAGVTPGQACRRPLPSAHSIAELVLHIDLYVRVACDAMEGAPMPPWDGTDDWPAAQDMTSDSWDRALESLFRNAERLATHIGNSTDERLTQTIPGREYDFYFLLHGIVQHSLYHAGQIALLKKAVTAEPQGQG